MDPWIRWITVPAFVAAAPAFAVQYLSVEQAQGQLFPAGTKFTPHSLDLTAEQKAALAGSGGRRVHEFRPSVWRASAGERPSGWFIIDRVIGKHEFITFALAIAPDGSVRGLEIMDYRESHGYEVRYPAWRRQFVGRRHGDTLELGSDIQNITGATLSCGHLTGAVKRLLALHHLVLK